jgi:hypothetical protein
LKCLMPTIFLLDSRFSLLHCVLFPFVKAGLESCIVPYSGLWRAPWQDYSNRFLVALHVFS